jgi:hypothetical protein
VSKQVGQKAMFVEHYLFCPMNFHEFTLLAEDSQLASVYATGTYVATRWQEV